MTKNENVKDRLVTAFILTRGLFRYYWLFIFNCLMITDLILGAGFKFLFQGGAVLAVVYFAIAFIEYGREGKIGNSIANLSAGTWLTSMRAIAAGTAVSYVAKPAGVRSATIGAAAIGAAAVGVAAFAATRGTSNNNDDDEDWHSGINPATNLPMVGMVDTGGNPYGTGSDSSTDSTSSNSFHSDHEYGINPATSLPMVGDIDTGGNPYGTGSMFDDSSSCNSNVFEDSCSSTSNDFMDMHSSHMDMFDTSSTDFSSGYDPFNND